MYVEWKAGLRNRDALPEAFFSTERTGIPETAGQPAAISPPSTDLIPPDAQTAVDIDTDNERFETDSAIGSDTDANSMASLVSSVLNYKYENGRTYHAYRDWQGKIPQKPRETNLTIPQDRLDLVHHVWKLILGGEIYRAPISKNIQHVLDVGTGTGIWAIEYTGEFRSATVIANDLSPIQPPLGYREPFDYIHIRNMAAAIADWPKLCRQSMDNLKPGDWIEIQEHAIRMHSEDGEVPPNTAQWLDKMEEAAKSFSKEMNVAKNIHGFLINTGVEDMHEDKYKVSSESVEAYSLALFSRVLQWDLTRLQVFLAVVRGEIAN
ncbi:S-adenosyl-L-methionine-dependent methyltransferase [Cadophora sp. MPI-SDFR-AT-0126]|nr:S-adenosyl-L-methionine-dependent methyltransferase [Leotiomycetes sp. MPI-SDFR-AT-0126]